MGKLGGPVMFFFVDSLNTNLKRQLSCRWLETPWCARDFTVMHMLNKNVDSLVYYIIILQIRCKYTYFLYCNFLGDISLTTSTKSGNYITIHMTFWLTFSVLGNFICAWQTFNFTGACLPPNLYILGWFSTVFSWCWAWKGCIKTIINTNSNNMHLLHVTKVKHHCSALVVHH